MSSPKKTQPPKLPWWILFLVIGLWATCWIVVANWCTTDYDTRWSTRGQFGDMFGVVNALFSGLAFAGLIITIAQQNHALRIQQQEIEDNGEIIKRQIFDSSFYNMLSMHNALVNSIDLRDTREKHVVTEGKDCFETFFSRLKREVDSYISNSVGGVQAARDEFIKKMMIDKYIEQYETFYKKNQKNLGHYYRNLYSLISMVDNSTLDDDVKYQYAKVVRAQLSTYELLLLFYNCLAMGKEKFKPLIEKYALLKHVDEQALLKSEHKDQYLGTAYAYVSKKKKIV